MKKLDVIVPVYNEIENVSELVRRVDQSLRTAKINYNIIFVDDNSTDGTREEIKKYINKYPITLHVKRGEKGKAYSVLEGSKLSDSEYVAMIDGDLQYPPEELPKMLELAEIHGVVVANRKSHETNFLRKIGSKANAFLFGKLLLGLNCDTQSGLKVFRREIITHLDESDVTPWTLDMPLLHTAIEIGYSIGCTEIVFNERLHGESKVNFIKTSVEIAKRAVGLKVKRKKVYKIDSENGGSLGAGYIHKKRRFITHTNLPYENSALKTFEVWQKSFLILLLLLFVLGLIINAKFTAILFIAILTAIYFVDAVFSGFVLIKSLHFPPELKSTDEELEKLDNKKLPTYTILCPLYKEGKVLPHFLENIKKIDWPKNKLDVLLLLEEDDKETQEVAKKLDLPSYVKVLVVPDSQPKTKPKACNYGLIHAKGDYVVIYDAEDRPDPLQLKKAYLGFQKVDPKTICLQSKLNYYNPNHNLLTRLFTAEYSLWFDVILPGLQSIDTHIPLGGTSNHFRTKDLVGIHAWDPFNVTEDCDLGVRIFKNGYKTAIIDSVTLEEANSNVKNWLRQRSRWIKGYLQTYLVHMKHPIQFIKQNGIHALLFQLVIGMRMTFMIINPILWVTTIAYFAARAYVGPTIEALYPAPVFYAAVFSLIFGNFMYLYNYMIGAAKREHFGVIKYVFFIPFYWVLTSVSACIAFYQLIVKPHYWEKTHHGLHLKADKKTEIKEKIVYPSRFARFTSSEYFGGSALIFASGVGSFFNFAYNAYLGRALSVEEFGLVSLISNFFALAGVVVNALGRTVTYKTAYLLGEHKKPVKEFLRSIFKGSFIVSILVVGLWLMSIPLLMEFFHSEDALPFLLFTPFWVVSFVGAVNSGFLSGNLKFLFLAFVAVVESVTKLVAAIVLTELGLTAWVYVAIPASAAASFLLGVFAVSRIKTTPIQGNLEKVKSFPKGFFASSVLTRLSIVAVLSLDVIMAKHYLPPKQAGEYALLSFAGKIVFFLGSLFSQFIVPLVSKAEGEKADSRKTITRLIFAIIFAGSIGFVGVGVLGQYTVPILFGSKSIPIVPYLVPFSFAMLCFTIASGVVSYNQVRGKHIFPVIGFAVAILEVYAIAMTHSTIEEISRMVFAVGIFYLSVVLIAHIIYEPLRIVYWNIRYLAGIFTRIPEKRKSKDGLRILALNWYDTRHVWGGGAEVYLQEVSKRWVKQGHQVTVFCGNDGHSPRYEVVDGVQVIRRGGLYTVAVWAFLYYVLRFIGRYDVIVDVPKGVPFFAPLYVRKPIICLIHHVHQDMFRENLKFPLRQISMFLEAKLMPLVYRKTKVVAVSESSRDAVRNVGMSIDREIDIATPGISIKKISIKKTNNPTIVSIGRLRSYKRIDILIHAMKDVVKKYPDAKLFIGGKGEDEERLKLITRSFSLENSVIFLGELSEEDKSRTFSKSWLSVQPSTSEGWGITVIEANACGTPVVASNVDGLRDSVVDGQTGILFPPCDVSTLSKVLIQLIEDKKYLKELSDNAYVWSKQFTWDVTSKKILSVLKRECGLIRDYDISQKMAVVEKRA